ncbi:hypothetical protein ACJJTC_013712 [Scirpophaga incertulas]
MTTRGKRLVDLVKKDAQRQHSETTPNEENDIRPESSVHYDDCTAEEWRVLNYIYDKVFPISQKEDDQISDNLVNESYSVIPITENASPSSEQILNPVSYLSEYLVDTINNDTEKCSNQEFNFRSPLTEDAAITPSHESALLVSTEEEIIIETAPPITDDSLNLSSVN